jgi:hypothetical protein
MSPPNNLGDGFEEFSDETEVASPGQDKKVRVEDLVVDIRAGKRTKDFLVKYSISLAEFEQLIKQMIREGFLTKEEFKAWKARRPAEPPPPPPAKPPAKPGSGKVVPSPETEKVDGHVTTYVINDPERNNSWALQLFSIKKESIKGAKFKVNMHGRRYAFVVEGLLFRGQVAMLASALPKEAGTRDRREQAVKFISQHGWAAYLENRAFEANFGETGLAAGKKARLVLLQCRNNTFLAAVHTPAPAINLYVSASLENIVGRLAKHLDTSSLNLATTKL